MQWLQVGGQQVHLFERADEPPDGAHLALQVEDVVAVYERARELGVLDRETFGYAAAELPGGEAQLYLRDPAGNLIEVDDPHGAARARAHRGDDPALGAAAAAGRAGAAPPAVLDRVGSTAGAGLYAPRLAAVERKQAVDELDRDRALADGRRDPLHRAVAGVPDRQHARHARLEAERRARERPAVPRHVRAGEEEALGVAARARAGASPCSGRRRS